MWEVSRIVKTRSRNDKAGGQMNQNTNVTEDVGVGTSLGIVAVLERYMWQRGAKTGWAPKVCMRPRPASSTRLSVACVGEARRGSARRLRANTQSVEGAIRSQMV